MRLILAVIAAGGVWTVCTGRGRLSIPVLRVGSAFAGAGLALSAVVLGSDLVVALVLVPAPAALEMLRSYIAKRRARGEAASRWIDLVGGVRSRLAAGDPLPDAVRVAGRSLGGEFVDLDRSWAGEFAAGLVDLQQKWRDPTADRVLTTLRIASRTGGSHVDAVLLELASSLTHELQVRRAHEAAVSQQQMTAGVALVAPWLILALSHATNPQTAVAFSSDAGHRILVLGACATVLGYVLARRASSLSRPPRVFR